MQQNNTPEWSAASAALFRKYVDTDAGQLFLAQVASGRPPLISNSNDINGIAIRASEVCGYEKCVNLIFSLMKAPEEAKAETEALPSLDNDALWPAELQHQPEPPKKA